MLNPYHRIGYSLFSLQLRHIPKGRPGTPAHVMVCRRLRPRKLRLAGGGSCFVVGLLAPCSGDLGRPRTGAVPGHREAC